MSNNFYSIKHFVQHYLSALKRGHGVHSPFVYKLCEEVFYNKVGFYDFDVLNVIRENIFSNPKNLEIEDLGAGSRVFVGNTRRVEDIAKHGISNKRQAEFLYRLVNFLKCENCLELGTSLGLTTLYIAKAANKGKVITVEGSQDLYKFASELGQQNEVNNVQFVHGNFEEVIPRILKETEEFDFVYFDGNHQYEASFRYFNWLLQKKHNDSVFVFDDIYWSAEMTRAWRVIQEHQDVTLSIDCFYFGLIFFNKNFKEKTHLKLHL